MKDNQCFPIYLSIKFYFFNVVYKTHQTRLRMVGILDLNNRKTQEN